MEVTVRHSFDFNRVFDIPYYQQEKYPNSTALNSFSGGKWVSLSIKEVRSKIDSLSLWFLRAGYQKGDKVILMPVMGSPEWMIIDFACQQIGLIVVPVHSTSRLDEVKLIAEETEARLLIALDLSLYEKFLPLAEQSKGLTIRHLEVQHKGYFEGMAPYDLLSEDILRVRPIQDDISADDVFTILYTSGSSGISKGVMLTHRNVVHNIKALLTLVPLEPHHRVLSFLPFSHVLERATCYGYMAFGVSIYFSQNKETFSQDFTTVKPYFCTCVPRVLEKMHDFLEEQSLERNFIKRVMIRWAMKTGKSLQPNASHLRLLHSLKIFFARMFVLNLWRKKLGGKIRYMVVGAAALRPDIGRLFHATGIRVAEGYGMTETAPLITINRYDPGQNRFGTVGPTIPGIDVRIDEPNEEQEGEIQVKGPNVTIGYYKRPELTKEAFTSDGWFRTGDVGKFVHQRFLQITDRKKEIFKTSSGKYIAPQPLQNHFVSSPFIEGCLILGFQRPFVTALLLPHFQILEGWCQKEGIHWTSPQFMVHNIKVRAKYNEEIERLNGELPNLERIRDFILCPDDWSTERGEITATFKAVRRVLEEHYKKEIEKMYS